MGLLTFFDAPKGRGSTNANGTPLNRQSEGVETSENGGYMANMGK